MSAARGLALVEPQRQSWRAALEAAVREEFRASPLVPPAGSPLAPPECGVGGCPRAGHRAPWGRFETRLCTAHGGEWVKDGRPAEKDDWLALQPPPKILQATQPCAVGGCPRSAAHVGLCVLHRREWLAAGRPTLALFEASAVPAAATAAGCRVPDCRFPPCTARSHAGLCDQHLVRFFGWRHHHLPQRDRSVERYVESLLARADGTVLLQLPLPDAPLLELELRFALQRRHDDGDGFISPPRWRDLVAQLKALGVESLLDHDREWWDAQRSAEGRLPRWMNYVNYAWKVLSVFRVHRGLADAWVPDIWQTPELPIDEVVGRRRTLDWRAIRPAWLRELTKRWARRRLRLGISTSHINGVRLAVLRFVEFCEAAGWPLEDPRSLTRELFDAFLDHVRGLATGAESKRQITGGVKQLFEDAHDLGWIKLRNPRVYLTGELAVRHDHLPRAIPAAIVNRLNEPASIELLSVDERAAVLVLMDAGLLASDTARLRLDPVTTGSDGAPYLRYWNHKRRREATVPISDRATEAIAAQQAWVREHFPGCEWLFPRLNANARGQQSMGYAFVYKTLRRWARTLDLRDEHGEPFHPHPHAFRHTYATALVNNDVDLFSVQALLDHDSPEMTWRYARLNNETLRRKWEQGQHRITIRGEIVPLDIDGELSDAAWAKEQLARAKQSLPNGWCGLPLQQTCPHPNACLTCPAFLTDETFLAQHREQLARTEQLIALGEDKGNDRLVEINRATQINLVAIIERAEQLERLKQTHTDGREDADAAA